MVSAAEAAKCSKPACRLLPMYQRWTSVTMVSGPLETSGASKTIFAINQSLIYSTADEPQLLIIVRTIQRKMVRKVNETIIHTKSSHNYILWLTSGV